MIGLGSAAPRQVTVGQLQPIPTVIAGTPVRYEPTLPPGREQTRSAAPSTFDAMRPDATGPAGVSGRRASTTDLNAHGLMVADIALETAIRCPACGRISAAGRRFCRCGATLVYSKPASDWEEPEERLPWYRRIRDGIGAGAKFWRSMRQANRGVRARFNRAQSIKNYAVRLLAVFGVVGVGVVAGGPWGGHLRTQGWQQVSQVLPWSYTSLAASGAVTDPAGADAMPGFQPGNAVDLNSGTSWAAAYTPPIAGGPPCVRQSGTARLVISFTVPVQVNRLTVLAGLPASSFDRTQQSRPKTVDVQLSDNSCATITLGDSAAAQSIDITGHDITSITLSIVDVFQGAQGSPTADLAAISEVVAAYR